jgi:cytochrome c oxidase subunit 2
MWKFAYPDGQSSIASLYIPTARPVRLLLTSRDVIHSFFVPDFRIKQDALPGRYTTAWFEVKEPGTHQVLCAEYCGTGHSVMRAQVVALDPSDYARWLAAGNSTGVVGGLGEEPRAPLAQVGGVALAGPPDVDPASEGSSPPRTSSISCAWGRRPPRSRAACAATRSTARRTSAPAGRGSTSTGSRSRAAGPPSPTRPT